MLYINAAEVLPNTNTSDFFPLHFQQQDGEWRGQIDEVQMLRCTKNTFIHTHKHEYDAF